MIILGIGSNLGDRLHHLREALRLIKQIPGLSVEQVSPIYISDALLPENAPPSWDTPYLNLAIRCHTSLLPQELLEKIKHIEKKVGRTAKLDWGPRIIDIDILAWDQLIQYDEKLHIPHEHLHERPFALWPLADVAPFWVYPLPGPLKGKTAIELSSHWGSRFTGEAPLHTKQIPHRIDTPILVGIVNLTPDSFSGDGYQQTIDALTHVEKLALSGAEIIDIGAESTGPQSISLDPNAEWGRLEPILTRVMASRHLFQIPPKISVDTRHSEVAAQALALGVDWINDVTGLDDLKMREVLASASCDIVFMHHLGVPVSQSSLIPLHEDPVSHVYQWALRRIEELTAHGIAKERLIFDVGIGYGKTAEQSLQLIKQISFFKALGVRLLVGHSRKSFLRQFTEKPPSERDLETTTLSLFLAQKEVDYLRVHQVESHARLFRASNSLF